MFYIVKLLYNMSIMLGQEQEKKDSVLYIIQKALPKNAITITLHPDAYARLKDDTEIVAALEAQPLISLVSA